MPKLQIGCNTEVRDGMVIHTENERTKQGRAGVMEFLLLNHPLDCTICDQAGECKLQDYAVDHGTGIARTEFDRVNKPKNVSWGDKVVFDSERCILCTLCVRFLDEIAETDEVSIDMRGDRATLIVGGQGNLTSPYQMNIIDICPVGALTSRDFRFKSRLWFMKFTETICTSCARGCNVTLGSRNEKILRMVPSENPEANDCWMCDHGRLHYAFANDENRLSVSKAANKPVPHPVAVQKAADALKSADRILAVASPFMTTEELFALKGVCDAAGVEDRYFLKPVGEGDDKLIHPEKCPNARGAALAGFAESPASPDSIQGEWDTLLYVEPREGAALPAELVEACKTKVIFSLQDGAADVRFPLTAWIEKDGTMISAGDRVQRIAKGTTFDPTILPEREILDRIHALLDERFQGAQTPSRAFERIAKQCEALLGVTWADLVPYGVALQGVEAGA